MPRLVKRIITEEQFVEEGAAPQPKKKVEARATHSPEVLDDESDEFVDEEEDDDEEQEQRRPSRRRSGS